MLLTVELFLRLESRTSFEDSIEPLTGAFSSKSRSFYEILMRLLADELSLRLESRTLYEDLVESLTDVFRSKSRFSRDSDAISD